MRFSWKHVKNLPGDFSELFSLVQRNKTIQVEVNRNLGRVRITCSNNADNSYQSIISNGVILREKDLSKQPSGFIEEQISKYSVDINSLPDDQVLKIIGGNYNILTEFKGTIYSTTSKVYFWKKKRSLLPFLKHKWQSFLLFVKSWFRKPAWIDIIDGLFAFSVGYFIYQINFSFLSAGIVTAALALSFGYMDWLVRQRRPYVLKILFLFVPSLYLSYIGFVLQ